MGIEINKSSFEAEEYGAFKVKLENNLEALKKLLARPGFGIGDASLGAELEMYIIDKEGKPFLINEKILEAAQDPQLTLELNRYNLEYNLSPHLLKEQPFLATETDIRNKLNYLETLANRYGGRLIIVGILPTLTEENFGPDCMSDRPRYHALVNQLIEKRGSRFKIDINGTDPLQLDMTDVTLEGANTSFQVHYRVTPNAFADTYNAIQLMTPLVLGIAANSPSLFGHMLWQETRIPLFKQSIDIRTADRYLWHAPPRVNFGNGWLRQGAYELFSEAVRVYDPILPICSDEDPLAVVERGDVPGLHELRLHQSSVWSWNRAVFDDTEGGHLRIEMRSLPAGPTAVDMVANAALLIGLAEGIRPDINSLLTGLPFYLAEHNFYRAAQHGLQARLVWPSTNQNRCTELGLPEILHSLLPLAQQGLSNIGISNEESERYLSVIKQRLESGQTGAVWQRHCLTKLEKTQARHEALHNMLELMLKQTHTNVPVGEWEI